ncbi:neutral alpha-glucosidase AB [Bacillus rossius redtenbacheri]|uniref:neutral alpha-glucosidase AB n=1 Tax=Bacillus rossius redtenbacheri TaxID=93214 RepID=UPI002FDCEF3E
MWWQLVAATALLSAARAVDRNNFKTCQQSSFCRRCRAVQEGRSPYKLLLDTLQADANSVHAHVVNTENSVLFTFQLYALTDDTFRFKINELSPLRPRYTVSQHVLDREPRLARLEVTERTPDYVVVTAGPNKVQLFGAPFRLDFYSHGTLVVSANARGLMRFEHLRSKPQQKEGEEGAADAAAPSQDAADTDPGAWEENFKSFHDTKEFGPEAVALDFSFVGAHRAYGIPEHADSFALKSTKNTDPYRLYNLDVFEYELHNPMALYGSIPFLVGHGEGHTAGVLWLNAAETWVDIANTVDQNVVSSIVSFVSGAASSPQVDAHFMSESGIVDVFVMLGPAPHDVFRQYTAVAGTTPLPQYFSIGYHQCRWNYNDQDDVRQVHGKFDEHDIPVDAIWLDIEHTDNKKYFTWDKVKFPDPTDMVHNLTAKGRKLVLIVDPHIKRDSNYFLHNDAESNGFYVKTKDGKDFEGWCWPGSSSYLDMFNPAVRQYYASRYRLDNFHGTTNDVHIWNDMNEPSVFSGPEVTMNKDCVHHGGWEHRDVHNVNGFMLNMASYEGLLERSNGKLRPFLLTRAFFVGSHRYTSVWTGDNMAEWGHLKITIPMCLSLSIAGFSFCGADVGGFFKNPDPELFVRWYQAGAFQPFFRTHSHIDTKRREPWLFDENTMSLIREAIRKRYSYLPYLYTLFYELETSGRPVMLPLWAEFPAETPTFDMDDQYLLGRSLLVHPVTDAGASTVSVYLPGADTLWYAVDSHQKYVGGGTVQIPVTMSSVPVFQRGGSILAKRERVRRAAILTLDDPFTLVVAVDRNNSASGTLYIDDGESFEYRKGKHLYLSFVFDGKKLTSRSLDAGQLPSRTWLERVVVLGWSSGAASALVESRSVGRVTVETTYDQASQTLTVRKPGVSMAEEWTVSLQ